MPFIRSRQTTVRKKIFVVGIIYSFVQGGCLVTATKLNYYTTNVVHVCSYWCCAVEQVYKDLPLGSRDIGLVGC